VVIREWNIGLVLLFKASLVMAVFTSSWVRSYHPVKSSLIRSYIKRTLFGTQSVLKRRNYIKWNMGLILQVISTGIYIVGSLSIVAYLYENLKSLFSIIKSVVEPFFRPNLPKTLAEKFGNWAGECFDR